VAAVLTVPIIFNICIEEFPFKSRNVEKLACLKAAVKARDAIRFAHGPQHNGRYSFKEQGFC
jgi:hypothetical protein